jgi:uncharacterized protein (TIRG00374 family)
MSADRESHARDEDDSQTALIRWRTTVPLLVVLAVAVYVLLPRVAELEQTLRIVQRLHWWAFALAAASQSASYVAGGFLAQRVARLTGDRLTLARSVRLGLAASAVGLVAAGPVGYAAVTLHWLKRQAFSEQGAALLGWLPALLNATALVVLALLGLLQLVIGFGISVPWPVSLALVIVAAALLATLTLPLITSEERLISIVHGARRYWSRVRRRRLGERELAADREKLVAARRALGRGGWRSVLLATSLRAAFDMLSLYFVFQAAGYHIPIGTMMAGYAVPQVIGRVAPGAGVGVVEAGMVGLYSALGVPTSTSVVVVLTYRLLSFWLPLIAGIPLAVLEQRNTARSN